MSVVEVISFGRKEPIRAHVPQVARSAESWSANTARSIPLDLVPS